MKKYLLLAFFSCLLVESKAQNIITVAGGNGVGNGLSQLSQPEDVFLDPNGNIYVADAGNARVIKFPPGSTSTTNGTIIAGGNGPGNAANQLNAPAGIYVSAYGDLYVADTDNHRVLRFSAGSTSASHGVVVAGGNGSGNAQNQLYQPVAVCLDGSGNLYVTDFSNNRIQKFPPGSTSATNGITVAGGNGQGHAANQLWEPGGIQVDAFGNLYVADFVNNRIQRFPAGSTSATNGVTVAGGNGQGTAANQMDSPNDLFVDRDNNIYIADEMNGRIQKFPSGSDSTTNGITVAGGNGAGTNANQLYYPSGVYVDTMGNIYISDFEDNRIQKWSQVTGYTSISADQTFSIYPNPNTGSFILESSNNTGKDYHVYDMLGRVVASGMISADKQTINMQPMSAGLYTLELQGGKAIRFLIEN